MRITAPSVRAAILVTISLMDKASGHAKTSQSRPRTTRYSEPWSIGTVEVIALSVFVPLTFLLLIYIALIAYLKWRHDRSQYLAKQAEMSVIAENPVAANV